MDSSILPNSKFSNKADIMPDKVMKSDILPDKRMPSTILPTRMVEPNGSLAVISNNHSTSSGKTSNPMALIIPAIIAIVIGIGWYYHGIESLRSELLYNSWERVESSNGSLYTLSLDFHGDKIDYEFDAYRLHHRIHQFTYKVVSPSAIVVDGRKIKIEMTPNFMTMRPAITSGDLNEHWFK